MAKRETMMLAHVYDSKKHCIGGYYVSEKLDGFRALWDGGVTRGMRAYDVPWANVEKDGRLKNELICTGLWTRYLKPVIAPNWWVDGLPIGVCLDGEIYGQDGWQKTASTVKRLDGGGDWGSVKYYIFDAPSMGVVFKDGSINIPQLKKDIRGVDNWLVGRGTYREAKEFEWNYKWIKGNVRENDVVEILEQTQLPYPEKEARSIMERRVEEILERGGEGVILRNPYSIWVPERSKDLLKVKGMNDAEGIVRGYIGGKGKLSGLFGALILEYNGKRLEMSGFTDQERQMNKKVPAELGGVELGDDYKGVYFKRGDVVTFKYRELSDSGVPKEARFWRKV